MHVTRLSVTPIKGLALHHPTEIDVRRTGVVGDRLFYLVDARDGLVSIAKTGGLVGLRAQYAADSGVLTIVERGEVVAEGVVDRGAVHVADFFAFKQVTGRLAPGPWDEVFSDRAGRPLRLVQADPADPAHDVEPVTLLGAASVRRLSEVAGVPDVDGRRFRMLIEFDGGHPHVEDEWVGRQLRIGSVVLEGGGPVQRCAGTTRNPDTGSVDLKTLALIGGYRGRQDSIFGLGFNFGVYARVVTEGRVALGDELALSDA
jgi:uncharacterized protein YcbX